MTGGVISGGWEYVWLAYGLTAVAFIGYGAMLIMQLRRLESGSRTRADAE